MRNFKACLLGVLGLAALSVAAACSDSTDMGSAGTGGAAAGAANHAGATSSGGSAGSVSDAGAAGSADGCAFNTRECQTCFLTKCAELLPACYASASCVSGLTDLGTCACTPGKDPNECLATFVTENGAPAEKLAECYSLNCEETCQ